MAFRKVKDVAAVVGSYEDAQGVTKNRYQQVGIVMKGDDGNSFILLNRHFNPAGVPFKPGDDKILLSLFDPREDAPAPARTAAPATTAPARAGIPADDDIPF